MKTIYTRDIAAQIVDMFETTLDKYNVTLPSEEDSERNKEDSGALYGSTYSELLDGVEEVLIDTLSEHYSTTRVVGYVFSGHK